MNQEETDYDVAVVVFWRRSQCCFYCLSGNPVICTLNIFAAALEAGATMDLKYHRGVWQSVKYTCCDAISKHAAGCVHTTRHVDNDVVASVNTRDRPTSQPTPPRPPKKGMILVSSLSRNFRMW